MSGWRSLKYEEVYLRGYQRVSEARAGIGAYLGFYNEERPHQALGYRTPREVFETGNVGVANTSTENSERGCIFEKQPVSYPQTAVTNRTAGDDLILAPSLS